MTEVIKMHVRETIQTGGGGGTTVIANPTLVGTEDELTGLQVGETKYKVPSGGSGSASWGNITGTLANQTDLQTALDGKLNASTIDDTTPASDKVYSSEKVEQVAFDNGLEKVVRNARRNLSVNNGQIVYLFDKDTEGISGTTSTGEKDNNYQYFKRNTHVLHLSSDTTRRMIDTWYQFETETIGNNTYGVWLYIPTADDLTALNYIQIQGGTVNQYGQFAGGQTVWQYYSTSLNVGWNFCPFNKTHTLVSFNGLWIRIVDANDGSAESWHNKNVYFDSMIKNYQMKPCVLLAFDNSQDNNMYSVCYTEAKARGIQGTFAYQGGNNPDGAEGHTSGVTRAHLNEMFVDGWDVAQYDGFNMNQDIEDIKAYNKLLRSQGLDMTAYFPRFNQITSDIWNNLKGMGFKLCRMQNSEKYIKSDMLDVLGCTSFNFSNTASIVLGYVNTAISNNQSVCILIHQIVNENDGTISNALLSEYRDLLDGLKSLRDSGDIDIITFKEYYYDSIVNSIKLLL